MKIFRTLDAVQIGSSACAIGMFDGVHLGHHMVLEQALRAAKINQLQSVVFTFNNHPQSLISQTPTPLLSTTEERLEAFGAMGFDAALVLDFTPDVKDLSAEAFVQTILLDTLHVKAVSIGYDHRFGKGRQGDGVYLKAQGEQLGFDVAIIDPVTVDQQIVSSTLIRKLLSFGDLERANHLLGRAYRVTGTVTQGVGRGRQIGFPTANLSLPENRLLPAQGVYAGTVSLLDEAQDLPAVCNIGLCPTFGDQLQTRMEVHLLDYQADLYGKTLTFNFMHHLRSEQTFPSVQHLVDQLNTDCKTAKAILGQSGEPSVR